MQVAEVVVDVAALHTPFSYAIPDVMLDSVKVGTKVKVPFGKRIDYGWIVEIRESNGESDRKLKEITKSVSSGPASDVVELCIAASKLWGCSAAQFLKLASPKVNIRTKLDRGPVGLDQKGYQQYTYGERAGVIWEAPNFDEASWVHSLFEFHRSSARSIIVVLPNESRVGGLYARLLELGIEALRYPEDYQKIDGDPRVVLGSRSAIVASVGQLGAILLVDACDPSMRDQRSPYWEAWRLAKLRSDISGCDLMLLGSAPPIDALNKELRQRSLERGRYTSGWSASVSYSRLIDLEGDQFKKIGEYRSIAAGIAKRSEYPLDFEMAVIHNQKGFTSQLVCQACSSIQLCEACGSVVHGVAEAGINPLRSRVESLRSKVVVDELYCAKCHATRPVVCMKCASRRIRPRRSGIDRLGPTLEGVLSEPVASISRETRDHPQSKVVLGTEALLYRDLSAAVVVFLDFDDFSFSLTIERAPRATYLYSRASKLVSRSKGLVVIQHSGSGDQIRESLEAKDIRSIYRSELMNRKEVGLAPYRFFAKITGKKAQLYADQLSLRSSPQNADNEVVEMGKDYFLLRANDEQGLISSLQAATRPSAGVRIEMSPRSL
ncbi:MAG: hypothetical protein HKL81_02635 [Acidimicrobiaceae bacterium]|nr:hypothetical protein [Acidimicrobiaceae bacterium]